MSREAQRIVNDAADRVAVQLCRSPEELAWLRAVCRAAAWAAVTDFLISDTPSPFDEERAA